MVDKSTFLNWARSKIGKYRWFIAGGPDWSSSESADIETKPFPIYQQSTDPAERIPFAFQRGVERSFESLRPESRRYQRKQGLRVKRDFLAAFSTVGEVDRYALRRLHGDYASLNCSEFVHFMLFLTDARLIDTMMQIASGPANHYTRFINHLVHLKKLQTFDNRNSLNDGDLILEFDTSALIGWVHIGIYDLKNEQIISLNRSKAYDGVSAKGIRFFEKKSDAYVYDQERYRVINVDDYVQELQKFFEDIHINQTKKGQILEIFVDILSRYPEPDTPLTPTQKLDQPSFEDPDNGPPTPTVNAIQSFCRGNFPVIPPTPQDYEIFHQSVGLNIWHHPLGRFDNMAALRGYLERDLPETWPQYEAWPYPRYIWIPQFEKYCVVQSDRKFMIEKEGQGAIQIGFVLDNCVLNIDPSEVNPSVLCEQLGNKIELSKARFHATGEEKYIGIWNATRP